MQMQSQLTQALNLNQNESLVSSKRKKTKKISANLPSFIKFERNFNRITFFFATILFLGVIGLLGFTAYKAVLLKEWSYYLFIPVGIAVLVIGTIFFFQYFRFSLFKKEILNHQLSITKDEPLVSIKNVYRRLMTANININWLCATTYIVCLFGILGTYLAAYFINLINYQINDWNHLVLGNGDQVTVICVWSFAGVCFGLLPIQFILNVVNRKRINDIDAFYGRQIIDETLRSKYRKTANIRGLIIFVSVAAILSFILVLVYLALRRTKRNIL